MSDAPKKRPLFQVHLSTCIVLMFVAGGLLWANISTEWVKAPGLRGDLDEAYLGWPVLCLLSSFNYGIEWRWWAVEVDALTALVMFLSIGICLERVQRRQIRLSAVGVILLGAIAVALLLANIFLASWRIPLPHSDSGCGWPQQMMRHYYGGNNTLVRDWQAWAVAVNIVVASAIMASATLAMGWLRRARAPILNNDQRWN